MPRIGKKEYPYTPEGKAAYARDYEQRYGQPPYEDPAMDHLTDVQDRKFLRGSDAWSVGSPSTQATLWKDMPSIGGASFDERMGRLPRTSDASRFPGDSGSLERRLNNLFHGVLPRKYLWLDRPRKLEGDHDRKLAEREHASQDAIAAERRQSRDTAGDELTVPVVVGDKDNQRIMHIPLLVEGQKNVKALERGQKPTDEQILIAIEAAFEKETGEATE